MQEQVIQGYRLSPQQRRLWQLQHGGNRNAYLAQCAVLIEGPLDLAALSDSLQELVRRHQILRTTFHCLDGMTIPVQVITDEAHQLIDWPDLSAFPQEHPAESIRQAVWNERSSFDWEQDPFVRWSLARIADNAHALIITLPALCADSTTLNNIVGEIIRSYTGFKGEQFGHEAVPEPLQYIVASEWQNDLFESEDFQLGNAFWQRQDLSSLGTLGLPFGKHSDRRSRFQPEPVSLIIEPHDAAKIFETAQRYAVSVSALLLTCWHLLAGRLAGQCQVITGTCYDGRVAGEMAGALGLFTKLLPIESRLDEQARFSRLLKQIDQTSREAQGWQEWFILGQPLRNPAEADEATFFPICFTYEEEPAPYVSSEARISILARYVCADRFELMLDCARSCEVITTQLLYNAEIYSRPEAQRILAQYRKLLESAIDNPETEIFKLEILTEEDKEQLLAAFTTTRRAFAPCDSIQELFEQQARIRPDALALVYEDESLTYAELNRRSNQLANYLRRLGVGTETRVALCMERGLEIVTALLAVLKAGGAYVPLEPGYPIKRMQYMLEDSQATVVLTSSQSKKLLPECRANVIDIRNDLNKWVEESEFDPAVSVRERNLAYVIYTSGSTGQPKGVGIEHAQLVNYVRVISEQLKLQSGWRLAMLSTFAADLGHTVLYPSLCFGAVLHIIDEQRWRDKGLWKGYQSTRQVDCLKITPTHAQVLLDSGQALPLKKLVIGGEACSQEWIKQIREWSPGCEVVNHYGPTECTVGAVTHLIGNQENGGIPLGMPLGNIRAYVLDGKGDLTPVGAPGELCLSGAGVARGYLGKPEVTSRQFVPDGYGREPGARMYKTGDLVRYRLDGNIEFIGRSDYQVKIRGFRIELREIEAVLAQHPEVVGAVVMVEGDNPMAKRLIAYVAVRAKSVLSKEDIRSYLAARLPEYMLPSAWVMLESLPLTLNGKIDRSVLREPQRLQDEKGTEFEPAQTPTEQLVAGVWSNLIGVYRVSRNDNFFHLGGHSLLGTQVISRLRECLQAEIPLGTLFEAPTVAGFAQKIDVILGSAAKFDAFALEPASAQGTYPLSFDQHHMWLREQAMPDGSGSYIWGSWRQQGERFNLPALEQSLSEIIRRHTALRTTFPIIDGEAVQVIGKALPMSLPVVDLSLLSEEEKSAQLRRRATEDTRRRFGLESGPLMRAVLLKLNEREQVLNYTLHHIIADSRSIDIIEAELSKLYPRYSGGQPSALEELQLQYSDYAVWQREYMKGEALERLWQYWKQMLAGAPERLELQTDRPRPQARTYRGAWQRLRLTKDLMQTLIKLSNREDVTLFMTMLAAYQVLLYRQSGQPDISVGSPVTFRGRKQIENLVGYFTNIIVLRVELSGNPTFREVLKRTREATLGAYTHQELPFDLLVEKMGANTAQSHAPLFQVWFNFLDHSSTDVSDFFSTEVEEAENNTNRYDLSMVITNYMPGADVLLGYNKALFDSESIKKMLRQYESLIEQIIANPDGRVLDFAIFDQPEYCVSHAI